MNKIFFAVAKQVKCLQDQLQNSMKIMPKVLKPDAQALELTDANKSSQIYGVECMIQAVHSQIEL